MTKTITFPSITTQEIYEKSKNKVGEDKLLYNIDWYKKENFFTKEKTRKGKREVTFELQHLGKSWSECDKLKGNNDFLNFAEVVYLVWKYPEFREMLERNYTWTSSRASDGGLVHFGYSDADGAYVDRWSPDIVYGSLGVAFSRSPENLKFDSLELSDLTSLRKEFEEFKEKVGAVLKI